MFQQLAIQAKQLYRLKAVRYSLQALLLLALVSVLYWQLLGSAQSLPWEELQAFWHNRFGAIHIIAILVVVALMPLNWALETHKWVHLMQAVQKISFFKAFKAVLAGLTVSLFTPNRMGEYGGRVLLVNKENRMRSIFATLVGSMSQWIVLIGGGLLGLLYLLLTQRVPTNFQFYGWMVFLLGTVTVGFVGFCYFRLRWLVRWARRWRLTRRWATGLHRQLFRHYSFRELAKALRLSGFRYLVYSLQYFCLLACFGFEVHGLQGFAAVLFVFLLQTGLPIPPTAGLLARGSLAVWVFGWFLSDSTQPDLALKSAILASTFTLWFINVLLPAAVGGVFLLKAGPIYSQKSEN